MATRKALKQKKVIISNSSARNGSTKPRLPQFKPIRLEKLLKGSKIDEAAALELGSKINRQLNELLATMGLDPDAPNMWERAFFCLARIHHGVGQVSFTPKKPSKRQAATWNSEHRHRFYEMMLELQDAGLNERQAVKKSPRIQNDTPNFPTRAKIDHPRRIQRLLNEKKHFGDAGSCP